MSADPDLIKAQAEAAVARARMMADVHQLQARLKPASLAGNAWDGVRGKSEVVIAKATRFANARPVAASAAVAGVVALLARRPLGRLLRHLARRKTVPAAPRTPGRRPRGDDR